MQIHPFFLKIFILLKEKMRATWLLLAILLETMAVSSAYPAISKFIRRI